MEEKEFKLIDFINLLVKWKKRILINCFVVCFFTAIYVLIMPQTYTSFSVILPPTNQLGSGLSSLISNLPVGGLASGLMGGATDETNTFIAILNSRSLMESVAKKFNLLERYKEKNLEETIKTLRDNVVIEVLDEGTIAVGVKALTPYFPLDHKKDTARNLAADMANYIISELDRINKEIQTTQAKYNRLFIEKRYFQNLDDMEKAEHDLQDFQEKYDAIALPEQVQAAIIAAADLKAQAIAKETELGALKTTLRKDHPEIKKAQLELNELKRSLKKMSNGGFEDSESFNLFPNFKQTPELGIKYIQLQRELEVQMKLYEFLLQQYEQAKLQEAKDTPTVQVLDEAIPPIKRSSPKRSLTVLAMGFITGILSIIILYILDSMHGSPVFPALKKLFSFRL